MLSVQNSVHSCQGGNYTEVGTVECSTGLRLQFAQISSFTYNALMQRERPNSGPDFLNWVVDNLESETLKPNDLNYGQAIAHTIGSLVGQIRNHEAMGGSHAAKVPNEIALLTRLMSAVPDALNVFQDDGVRSRIQDFLQSRCIPYSP